MTGGLGGLGMGLVRTLLQSGADVIVTDMATQPPPQPWSMLFSRRDESENKLLTLGQMVSSSLQALPVEYSSTYLAM